MGNHLKIIKKAKELELLLKGFGCTAQSGKCNKDCHFFARCSEGYECDRDMLIDTLETYFRDKGIK